MGGLNMSDSDKTDETEVPFAPGLDEWHAHTDNSVDAEGRQRATVEAEDFQQARAERYLFSGGMDDTGGWIGSMSGSYGARGIYAVRGRMWDWR
jgi:hypothetical protein